jgi:hypothetical protein
MKNIPFSTSLIRRGLVFSVLGLACLLMWKREPADAQNVRPLLGTSGCPQIQVPPCSGPTCDTYTLWDTGSDGDIRGFNPQSIQDDVAGVTNQVGAPAMVAAMENTLVMFNGLMYWNPKTNFFKTFGVIASDTSGTPPIFQFAVDLNRSTSTNSSDWQPIFGAGDVWATVYGKADYAPYMNFRGTNNFTRWNVGATTATGVRVNPANGKVYFGNFGDSSEASEIIELDPATNPATVRKWPTGNQPYQLFFDGKFVWATAVGNPTYPAAGTYPDQILRLDPAATWGNNLTRWNLPSNGSFQQFVGPGTNPNYITMDLEGKVWFTETNANTVGRLDPAVNTITEYSKQVIGNSVLGPQNIATSGICASLQAFFTEDPGNAVSVLNPTRTGATVATSSFGVQPTAGTAQHTQFMLSPVTKTILPTFPQVMGADPGGIFRIPPPPTPPSVPPAPACSPKGITRVVSPGTVFGSLHDIGPSGHVFQLSSPAITAPPPSACRGEDGEADEDDAKHDGGKAHASMHHKECEENQNEMAGEDDYKDPSSGIDFRSTQFTSVIHDEVAHSVTVTGLGTNNGLPVAFTIIAVDSTLVPPGTFTITLSNGYTNTGSLSAGSILLNHVQ